MPPKKKSNKKGNDDWESELGEVADPIAAATQAAKAEEASKDDEDDEMGGGGGLMAALKKNKAKKKQKGKLVEEDYVDGEDPPEANGVNGHEDTDGVEDLAAKAPTEATTDDLFAETDKKGKGGKGKGAKDETKTADEDGDELGEDGKVKSKKEKEKEKREREKQRKKEQVRSCRLDIWYLLANASFLISTGCKEEDRRAPNSTKSRTSQSRRRSKGRADTGGETSGNTSGE